MRIVICWKYLRYIHRNPLKAGIVKNQPTWILSSIDDSEEMEKFYSLENMSSILGCTSFEIDLQEKFFELINRPEVPESKVLALDAERVITCVCKHYRISRDQVLVSKRGTENLPRDIAIYLVHRFCKVKPCQVSV